MFFTCVHVFIFGLCIMSLKRSAHVDQISTTPSMVDWGIGRSCLTLLEDIAIWGTNESVVLLNPMISSWKLMKYVDVLPATWTCACSENVALGVKTPWCMIGVVFLQRPQLDSKIDGDSLFSCAMRDTLTFVISVAFEDCTVWRWEPVRSLSYGFNKERRKDRRILWRKRYLSIHLTIGLTLSVTQIRRQMT